MSFRRKKKIFETVVIITFTFQVIKLLLGDFNIFSYLHDLQVFGIRNYLFQILQSMSRIKLWLSAQGIPYLFQLFCYTYGLDHSSHVWTTKLSPSISFCLRLSHLLSCSIVCYIIKLFLQHFHSVIQVHKASHVSHFNFQKFRYHIRYINESLNPIPYLYLFPFPQCSWPNLSFLFTYCQPYLYLFFDLIFYVILLLIFFSLRNSVCIPLLTSRFNRLTVYSCFPVALISA